MGPNTVKFPKKGPIFPDLKMEKEEGKKERKKEIGKRKRKKKKRGEKCKNERRERDLKLPDLMEVNHEFPGFFDGNRPHFQI